MPNGKEGWTGDDCAGTLARTGFGAYPRRHPPNVPGLDLFPPVSLRPSRLSFVVLPAILIGVLANPPAMAAEPAGSAPRVSAWLPYWDEAGIQDFVAHAEAFETVLPFWYELTATGAVRAYDGADDPRVLEAAGVAGVAVLPTVNNDFDPRRVHEVLASDAAIDAHVAKLAAIAARFDGIDVDYESLHAEDRSRFTRFVDRLATAVHAIGKRLSITVHPKTSEPGAWSGPQAQNWAAIGAAADEVRVMAYDAHWSSSAAGPVAPASWVDAVASFAAATIDPAKVHLGAPLYGYDWIGSRGSGVVWQQAEARRVAEGATLRRSSDGGEPWFRYATADGTRTVWYSDARSSATKLAIADAHGLAGVTFWRLGGQDPALWDLLDDPSSIDVVAPGAVPGVTARDARRAIVLRWSPVADETTPRYRIFRATSSAGPLTKIAVVTGTRFRLEGLRPGTQRWFVVQALDAAGNAGPRSGRVSARATR